MTFTRFALASAAFYRRTHTAVALGVATAVAVLGGALLVGSSVRGSLAELATSRLGRADIVIGAETPFTEALGMRVSGGLKPAPPSAADRQEGPASASPNKRDEFAPMLVLKGVVTHQASRRRAGDVLVYGVDARFFALHGVPAKPPEEQDVLLSPDLAAELGAAEPDDLLIRVARPTDIPIDSLHGRRDDVGRSIRMSYRGTLAREAMGEFSLAPGQGPVRAVFVALDRLQRDLGLAGRVNTLLLADQAGAPGATARVQQSLQASLTAADLALKFDARVRSGRLIVESTSGLLSDPVADAIDAVARGESLSVTPILTWLATRIMVAGRTIPYSIVTAIGTDADGDAALARLLEGPALAGPGVRRAETRPSIPPPPAGPGAPPLLLTEWAAHDLRAAPGDAVELAYFRWGDEGRLVTDRAAFRVAGIVPMRGLAVDRRLAPDYPGITSSNSFADWDPPFPIVLKLVRPIDEDYWKQYRTAPKAFMPLSVGQRLWRTRYGQITSLRIRQASGSTPGSPYVQALAQAVERAIDPQRAGFTVVDVRSQNLAAAAGATDFGAYFSYFSFFLMVSALLLTALFFRLSVEQRLPQVGVLRATGFPLAAIRRLFVAEGSLVAAIGAVVGVALAIGWAALMMYGLRTWWRDAVGTTLLRVHLDWRSLVVGAAAGAVAALGSIVLTVRSLSRMTPRALLSAGRAEPTVGRRGRSRWLALAALALASALSAGSTTGLLPAVAGFFGAGALVLIGGLAAANDLGGRSYQKRANDLRSRGLLQLALANVFWRPGRSLTAAGLVAAAVFLLVSVDSFRKRADADAGPASGTGGYAIIAESALPVVHALSTPEGRRELGLDAAGPDDPLAGVDIVSLRLRPGDDASCLNLYQPKRPRVLGIPAGLIDAARFRFAKSIATSDAEHQNPWRLLGDPDASGVIPAIVDQTSLQYVLHAGVGDVITIDADTTRPVRLRIVASLDDSVLQGEILVADRAFQQVFSEMAGYRMFLVGVTPASPSRIDAVTRALEEALEPYGFDAIETSRRLEAYHRVENTYLSTFQALGGLGLVLGILGLVAIIARNVLERRRELALLGAAGYTGRDLQRVVLSEHLALVVAGVVIGVVAALVAIAPVLASRGGRLPVHALVWLIPVGVVGIGAAMLATRSVRRLPLVASLRSE